MYTPAQQPGSTTCSLTCAVGSTNGQLHATTRPTRLGQQRAQHAATATNSDVQTNAVSSPRTDVRVKRHATRQLHNRSSNNTTHTYEYRQPTSTSRFLLRQCSSALESDQLQVLYRTSACAPPSMHGATHLQNNPGFCLGIARSHHTQSDQGLSMCAFSCCACTPQPRDWSPKP